MNVFILGKNGFIGKSLIPFFKEKEFNVIPLGREDLNLLDKTAIISFFSKYQNDYNVIINCAVKNGWRTQTPNERDFYENILMHENLSNYAIYKKMFVFSSGADSDRDLTVETKESEYKNCPKDFYGLSKYITSKISQLNSKITVLRIFNCFGDGEKEDRFITKSVLNSIKGEKIVVWEDRKFDFFYIEDLFKLIYHCIKQETRKEINCCYDVKRKLSEIATFINLLNSHQVEIKINKISDLNYIGDSDIIDSLGIKFIGLECGIKKIWKHKLNALMEQS